MPDLSLSQLPALDLTAEGLGDLFEGHRELVETHIDGGLLLGAAGARGGAGMRVLGIGVAENEIDGSRTDEAALVFLVDCLADQEQPLATHDQRGVPILCREGGKIRASTVYQSRNCPAQRLRNPSIVRIERHQPGRIAMAVDPAGLAAQRALTAHACTPQPRLLPQVYPSRWSARLGCGREAAGSLSGQKDTTG